MKPEDAIEEVIYSYELFVPYWTDKDGLETILGEEVSDSEYQDFDSFVNAGAYDLDVVSLIRTWWEEFKNE